MDLVNFIYLDDRVIDNLYSQVMPNIKSIIDREDNFVGNEGGGEISSGIIPIITPKVKYMHSSTDKSTLEHKIKITTDQKAIALIDLIKHGETEILPFRRLVNERYLELSKITVFSEVLLLNAIYIAGEKAYDSLISSYAFDNPKQPLAMEEEMYFSRTARKRDYEGFVSYINRFDKKDINATTFSFIKYKTVHCENDSVLDYYYDLADRIGNNRDEKTSLRPNVNDIPYSLCMNMGGSNFKVHIRHLTYLARDKKPFVFYIFGEVTNTGNEEYIVKPFAVWRSQRNIF